MKIVGIICEYNPFHLGHKKQLSWIRSQFAEPCAIVCLMSGNFVQRGQPAVFPKALRAEAALRCGADLVLELPTAVSLSSAEGFAAGGVKILSPFCDYLCFGTETGTAESLMATAKALLTPEFSAVLRQQLDTGISFPAARQAALKTMGCDGSLLENPNDILAVEYCKAILSQKSPMQPLPLCRQGSYHADIPDSENPSATALRRLIAQHEDWSDYAPKEAAAASKNAAVHTLSAGEIAILCKLRSMTDAEFEALPYGSEGLWRKFMHACRSQDTLENILAATKSKRYTRSRLDRMVMCAYLGITQTLLDSPAPYVRVLGFRESGREVLKKARQTGTFLHVGESADHPYWLLEQRWADLYGLFVENGAEPAGSEPKQRIVIL